MPFDRIGLDFLVENQMHNSREWFAEHREIYDTHVLKPMQELVEALTPTMLEIDPRFITIPKTGKCIARINRDTRFTKDKSLYRANLWCMFMRDKKLYDGLPGFFFDISAEGYTYGCGYYKASAESMEIARRMILEDSPRFWEMHCAFGAQNTFALYGERYRKPRYPDQPPEKQFWLDLKNIGFEATGRDADLLFSGGIAGRAAEDFRLLAPMYRFMMEAEERRAAEHQRRNEEARGLRPRAEW